MAQVPTNFTDQIEVQNNNDGNYGNNSNDTNVVNNAVNVPVGAAGGGNGTMNFNLRVEQNKIP
jgi:hypothetical protein